MQQMLTSLTPMQTRQQPARRRALGAVGRRARHGFALTELIVVISIIVLLMAITFPVISSMRNGSRIEAGLNTVGMSVDVARQWVEPIAWAPDDGNNHKIAYEKFSGTAALFCPTGEVRIVYNVMNAKTESGNDYLEDIKPTARNGYRDLPGLNYIAIPRGVGVVGILRKQGTVRLLRPPFAIAFTENGNMSFGDDRGLIYYDGNGTPGFNLNATRASVSNYNPLDWDGTEGSKSLPKGFEESGKMALPFEAIECVPGVIIYSLEDFNNASVNGSPLDATLGEFQSTSNEYDWLIANGRSLFFSPQTGSALQDELVEE